MAILNVAVYSTQLMEIEESSSRPGKERLKKSGLENGEPRSGTEADAGNK